MTRSLRIAVVLSSLAILDSGCGGSSADNPATKGNTVQAAADRRIKFKDEYKKVLEKNPNLFSNPKELNQLKKRPPGTS